MARRWYWLALGALVGLFLLLLPVADDLGGRWGVVLIFLPFYWIAFCLMSQRCHDVGMASAWLALLLIPIAGVVWCFTVLGFRRGDRGENQYGSDPRAPAPDYFVVQAIS
jgi:uncharacterized membrane protein YhaH (DUF805 family)